MRRTIAAIAVAAAFVGAVPATSAAEDTTLSSPIPGCYQFGEAVANAGRRVQHQPGYGGIVSWYAQTYDGDPLRFDRDEKCPYWYPGDPGHPFEDPSTGN